MAFDALGKLAEGGNPIHLLNDQQRTALSQLSEHEVDVITSVQKRLAFVGDEEVEGQDINIFRIN